MNGWAIETGTLPKIFRHLSVHFCLFIFCMPRRAIRILIRPTFQHLLFVCGLSAYYLPVVAQDFKLIGVNYTRFFPAEIKNEEFTPRVEVDELTAFASLPIQLKNEKTVLINGFQYTLVASTTESDTSISFDERDLHQIGYRFSVFHKFQKKQSKKYYGLLASFLPNISSTLGQPLQWDDFIFNGTMQFNRVISDSLSYGVGIVGTTRFGSPRVLPTLQMQYVTAKSRLLFVLAIFVLYERFFGKWGLGLQASVNGSYYNAETAITTSDGRMLPVDHIGYTRVLLAPRVTYPVYKYLQAEFVVGMTVARRFELESESADDQFERIRNAPFFRLGLYIIPPNQ